MIRDDLDTLGITDLQRQKFRIRPWRLFLLLTIWLLLVTGGCALIFRWTNQPQGYSAPLRTRPPR